jgi:hypothetical protein
MPRLLQLSTRISAGSEVERPFPTIHGSAETDGLLSEEIDPPRIAMIPVLLRDVVWCMEILDARFVYPHALRSLFVWVGLPWPEPVPAGLRDGVGEMDVDAHAGNSSWRGASGLDVEFCSQRAAAEDAVRG